MSRTNAPANQPFSPERLAEASVWIAKMHGDARGREIEDGLRRWLQANPQNARAFELATEGWEESARLRSLVPFRPLSDVEHRPRRGAMVASFAGLLVLTVASFVWFQNAGVVATAVGEQRQLVLEDGTRVLLNTNTRIVVKYDERVRHVELTRGEAFFKVAKRVDWPFVVLARDRQVRAIGTCFIVRNEAPQLAVTLVEGIVVVSPVSTTSPGTAAEFTLAAGQRLTFGADSHASLDTPSIETITAWRRGQVILDDTPLQAAAAELNRYNEIKLVVADPQAAAIPLSGLFQAGDSTHFANAVAQAYGLTVLERGDAIVLSGEPMQ